MKLKIGITGQNGFVGKHLFNTIGLFPEEFERICFQQYFFDSESKLDQFVGTCDVIVHLASINRDSEPETLYQKNITLVKQLISALERTNSKAHVLFSSSLQEELDNLYGRSKKEGRELFVQWATKTESTFTGLVIPNVFGPFGRPYYNSFIATFAHQLTHNEQPKVKVDAEVKLIFVAELVEVIINEIRNRTGNPLYLVPHTSVHKVSEILNLLEHYKADYFIGGNISALNSKFQLNLFNTFRSYIDIKNHNPVKFVQHTDGRGSFVEIVRLATGGQVSFSTTFPGVTRGNHFHTRKIERFAVIKGEALIQLRKIGTDEILSFKLSGEEPAYVDMPIWYTHNIKNIGADDLYTIFWINEFYDPADADTYFEAVQNGVDGE